MNKDNFDKLISSEGKTLVKFGASWCGPCKIMGRVLNQVKEKGDYTIYEIDVEKNPELKKEYSIKNLPTTIVFQESRPIKRFTGLSNINRIINLMK